MRTQLLTVAFAFLIGLARGIDSKFFELFVLWPASYCLLSLLDPLQITLPLLVGFRAGSVSVSIPVAIIGIGGCWCCYSYNDDSAAGTASTAGTVRGRRCRACRGHD